MTLRGVVFPGQAHNLRARTAGREAAAALLTRPSPLLVEISAVCSLLNSAQTSLFTSAHGPETHPSAAETAPEAGSSVIKKNGAGGGGWGEEVGEAAWGALAAAHCEDS